MCFFSIFSKLHWVIQHHDVHGTKRKRFFVFFINPKLRFLKKTCRVIRVNYWFASRCLKVAIMDVADEILWRLEMKTFLWLERPSDTHRSIERRVEQKFWLSWSLFSCLWMNCFRIDFILWMCHRRICSFCHPKNLSTVWAIICTPTQAFFRMNSDFNDSRYKSRDVVKLGGFVFVIWMILIRFHIPLTIGSLFIKNSDF